MAGDSANPPPAEDRRSYRWPLWSALLVVSAALVFLLVPTLAGVPVRLIEGCGKWIALAGALELLSAVGFVVFFKLVFAAPMSWRRSIPAGLRALGASTIFPAGGLVGPTMGAWSASREKPSLSQLARSTVTFVILTNAPGAIVLAALGVLMWLGLPGGPHEIALTLLPAALAAGLLTATWLAGHAGTRQPSPARRSGWLRRVARATSALSDGVTEAHALVRSGNWKLVGPLAYYAFDNAVLWAAFHAYGHTPAVGVVMMGYLVGSLAGALPLPAGLGAVDGGLIGALVLYGAPSAPAAAAVLLYRGISLLLPVVLAFVGSACVPAHRRLRDDGRRSHLLARSQAKRRAARGLAAAPTD